MAQEKADQKGTFTLLVLERENKCNKKISLSQNKRVFVSMFQNIDLNFRVLCQPHCREIEYVHQSLCFPRISSISETETTF